MVCDRTAPAACGFGLTAETCLRFEAYMNDLMGVPGW